jgi:4a-hydroxytetrahydrobiopterin dehydratase
MLSPDPVSNPEVDLALEGGPWRREGEELVFERTLDSFPAAIQFVNGVAAIAEAQEHHPDIDIRWRTVHLRVSTHEIGGLSIRDLEFARSVEAL